MRYLPDELWRKLPAADFRPRFFVETYVEKLGMDTPHFSQARLMNIYSCCNETLAYIDEYQANDKNGGYVLLALDEIDSCLSTDVVAQKLFAYTDGPRKKIFKKIRGGDLSSNQLKRLSIICKAILSREDEYADKLLAELRDAIVGTVDLTQKKRVTSRIYTLTGLYVTQLLNKGFSPTYLYNRAEMFTRAKNYAGKSFDAQFDAITERLRSRTTQFDVYFALKAHKSSCLLSIDDDLDFKFSEPESSQIESADFEKLGREFSPNVIAKASIEATDHVTASWRVKDKLDKLLDAVTALELNPKIQVSSHCVSVTRNQQLTHTRSLNINLLLNFLSSEGGTYFSGQNTSIRHSFSKLNEQGKEQLGRSLRYLRLARESISIEQKLLNLWISIESIFSDGESSILVNILEYVPEIYAVSALSRRVHYLKELLGKCDIATTPLVQGLETNPSLMFSKDTSDELVFKLLQNEAAATELFDSIHTKEHLKFKLLSTFDEMKNNTTISHRVKQSESDVARQLRRIYFLRNKIAHTGHYANIRPQLVTHLLDYLAVCYMAISTSAHQASKLDGYSISDFLAAYKLGTDIVLDRASSQSSFAGINELMPTPIV